MHFIKKISALVKPYWPRILGGIVLSLMVSGITGAIAWSVKPALDTLLAEHKYEYLQLVPAAIVILFALQGSLSFAQTYLMKSAGMKLMREMRIKLYDHMLELPVLYFSKESSGVIMSRVINDVKNLNGLISTVIKTFVVEVPTVLILLGIAFYRRWDLTLITLLLLPLLGYGTKKIGKRVKLKRKEAQKRISFVTHKIGEAIHGMKIIKVFNREESMSKKFKKENQKHYREMLRVLRLKEFTKLFIDIATGVGIAVAMWYGITLVLEKTITPGDLASILVAIYMLFAPVKKIGNAYNSLQEVRASIERIDVLFDEKHEEQGDVRIEDFRDSLRYDGVSFSYPGTDSMVLDDISFEIKQGEIVAVVGQSGAGKSTLVDLMPRFNRPGSGQITIDGMNIERMNLKSLRELIGIVNQDIVLFNDTIKENIAFGSPGASQDAIIEAAKLAYADEFISKLPDGYETFIGERGLKLSGGQRQRIAIARAILKNPSILILDEATSSLDSVSEGLVQKALESLMKERTTIVIAHRLSTVKNADKIMVLQKGKIEDMGTHDELYARNRTYMNLYKAFSDS